MAFNNNKVVRNYYILPCCLLLLNLANNIVSYKSGIIANPFLRTTVVMLLVLFGSSLTAFVVAPALASAVRWLHRSSRRNAGELGEMLFFAALGALVFWMLFVIPSMTGTLKGVSLHGTAAIVPPMWRN